jgi:hypothetical protein
MLKPGKQKRKKTRIDTLYKRLQTEVQYEIRKAGKKYMTDVICDKDNTNKLWSYMLFVCCVPQLFSIDKYSALLV